MKLEDGVFYAIDVVKGNIVVCNKVRQACQRFLNFLEDKHWQYEFIAEYVDHVLKFFSTLKHTKGADAGKPLILEPWQILAICSIYGFRNKKDHTKRMVTDVIIFIPRKAGKSTFTAGIGLYELQFGEAGAEVFTLATSREQATIVFDASKGFIENMPIEVKNVFELSKYEIKKRGDNQSTYRALSRDNKKSGDGKAPSCCLIDEAAAIVDRNSIEVLHSGMVARKNPLRIYITTASFTKDTKFYEDMQAFENMLDGEAKDNPHWFGLLYGLDPQDD
jgi:phage terminase large subunit-like protein